MANDFPLPRPPDYFLDHLMELHRRLRTRLRRSVVETAQEELAAVTAPREGDTTFAIDVQAEEVLEEFFRDWGEELPLLLVAEGFPGDGGKTFPQGTRREDVAFTCIVDPIDGTRGLMYGKRSGWVLSAVAPPPHPALPTLADVAVALQTELPTARSPLSDVLYAGRGQGVHGETHNLENGDVRSFQPRPSGADSLRHGFATVSKFFPGTKVQAAEVEERLFAALLGSSPDGNPEVFDDEYLSTGGQLYELTVGHDRFVADLRPLLHTSRRLCAHPYDLCTELIAREAGVVVTDALGGRLRYPLDVRVDCAWAGYANQRLWAQIEPVLLTTLRDMGVLP